MYTTLPSSVLHLYSSIQNAGILITLVLTIPLIIIPLIKQTSSYIHLCKHGLEGISIFQLLFFAKPPPKHGSWHDKLISKVVSSIPSNAGNSSTSNCKKTNKIPQSVIIICIDPNKEEYENSSNPNSSSYKLVKRTNGSPEPHRVRKG